MADLESSADEGEKSLGSSKTLKKHDNKMCGVCGDRALGYNFNAITCESCKAFFRRNALKNKEFRCPFNDSCKVTNVTRRFCQRCRLRKCFDIGMKKEWILSEEEKQKKKTKIALNRARKMRTNSEGGLEEQPDTPELDLSPPALIPVENFVIQKRPGRGRPRGVRSRKRRHMEVGSTSDDVIIPAQATFLEKEVAPIQDLLIPKTEFPASTENIISSSSCQIESSPKKSLARLYSERGEEDHHTANKRHQSAEIPTSSVTMFEEQGLVAGLLRSSSESPNEQQGIQVFTESPPFNSYNDVSSSINCYRYQDAPNQTKQEDEEIQMIQDREVGREEDMPRFDIEFDEHLTSHIQPTDLSSTQPTDLSSMQPTDLSSTQPTVLHPTCYDSPPERRDSTTSIENSKFEFSIQEALSMLQPSGCRNNREPTTYANSVMDSIVNTAIRAEYSAFKLFSNASNPGELNSVEKMKLHELYEANRGLLAPLCEDANFKDLPDPSLINIINLTEIAIRRLIKMSKKLSSFKNLCQEDQIGLLKAGCTELMILKSVTAYDPDKDSWKIRQDQHSFKSIKLKVLKTAPGNVYEEHKRFILAFKTEWRQDLNIMLLLSAIILFTPERPFLLHPEAIRHEQGSYLYLLKRYLECKYSSCEGRSYYYKLLERISHLHVLNEDHVRVFLEANPKEMEPLLIEIFDLKQS